MHPRNFASRIVDIGEYHRGAAEHVILQCHALIHGYIILNLDALPHTAIRADHDVLADLAIFA